MSLLNDSLSVWEIGFRWAGFDPDKLWIRIPLPVRDNFRILMDAILRGDLPCESLSLKRWRPESTIPPEYYIRPYIDEVYACIWGHKFDRKLLRWGMVQRWAIQQWCERRDIPLPEFWFPPGWKFEYEWEAADADESGPEQEPTEGSGSKESEIAAAGANDQASPTQAAEALQRPTPAVMSEREAEGRRELDQRQRRKITCQEVALQVWAKQPNADVKVIANSREVQELAGGEHADFDVLLRWLGEVDRRDPSKRRGPKRRK
jgi:hypothetical protein